MASHFVNTTILQWLWIYNVYFQLSAYAFKLSFNSRNNEKTTNYAAVDVIIKYDNNKTSSHELEDEQDSDDEQDPSNNHSDHSKTDALK